MVEERKEVRRPAFRKSARAVPRWAWLLILVADAGLIPWGAMAALAPGHLPGPAGTPIVAAEYHGFTGGAWAELTQATPSIAAFIMVLFRVYGAYCMAVGILLVFIAATAFRWGQRWAWWALLIGNTIAYGSAITFDRVVNAIGIFEMTEYLGIALVYVSLALTTPFGAVRRGN